MAKQQRNTKTTKKTKSNTGAKAASQAAKNKLQQNQASIIPEDINDPSEGVTSPRELLSRYRTAVVTLSSGTSFRIRSVNTGDFYAEVGALLFTKMLAANIDTTDPQKIQDFTENQLPIEEQLEIVNTDENLRSMRAIACAATISINFVNKPQHELPENSDQISIDILTHRELGELSDAIVKLSNPDNDVATFSENSNPIQTEQPTPNGTN